MPDRSEMSSSNSPPASTMSSYMEQTAAALSSVASYLRLPALASTVRILLLLFVSREPRC